MGTQAACCAIKPNREHQLTYNEQDTANIDGELQDLQIKVQKNISKFSTLCQFQTTSMGLNRLNQIKIDINRFDTMFEHETQVIEMQGQLVKRQDSQIKMKYSQTHTKVVDYISFKKYSPKAHYKFLRMISSGRSSKIYQAVSINTNSQRAIKVIRQKQLTKANQNKFTNIMTVLNKLDHPYIIRFYQVYEYKFNQYLVMELIEGGSLKEVPSLRRICRNVGGRNIADGYFQQIKIIVKQILYALTYLHQNKIAHLNIHTKSILLFNKFGSKKQIFAKLVGFGSSMINITNDLRQIDQQINNRSQNNQIQPPQLIQNKSICLKTDIWMLGITIFQTITKLKITKNSQKQDKDYEKLPKYLSRIWKKLQQQLGFHQQHCLDLILKMIRYKTEQRPTAKQCLQHLWFLPLQFDSISNEIKDSSTGALRGTIIEKKTNNLITYIQNLIMYRNINTAEMMVISEIFTSLDKDKNGIVAIEQLIQYFKQYKDEDSEPNMFEFCLQIVNNLDNDGSGAIDYFEFSKALVNKQKHITKQAIEETFDHIDQDGNGKIVLSQLKNILFQCNLDELQYYMKKIDENFDQTITKVEFINYCLTKFQQKWAYPNKRVQNKANIIKQIG